MDKAILIVGIILFFSFIGLIVAIAIAVKKDQENKKQQMDGQTNSKQKNSKEINDNSAYAKSDVKNVKVDYVDNFLEFDDIEDSMIIQKKGDKYLMVIKCQGINYDLMSEEEMLAVEEGFIQFLNTLRFPIQLYVQTNSLDLTESLREYNERVDNNEIELTKLRNELRRLEDFDEDNFTAINNLKYEINRKQNVYDYGKDVIGTVEKLSKSKNILQQNYYIIVPYFANEMGTTDFNTDQIKSIAFEELYTRCMGLISSLAMCSVRGEILNSFDLVELLYVAYNRDEGHIYSFKNAIGAQYDRYYHTGIDVKQKRLVREEREAYETAARKANEAIIKASGGVPGDVYKNNEMIQQLVFRQTKQFIKDYSGLIDDEILQKASENVTEEYKEQKQKEKEEKKKEIKKRREEKEKLIKDKEEEVKNNKEDSSEIEEEVAAVEIVSKGKKNTKKQERKEENENA